MRMNQVSKRDGYEDVLFPMQVCNITQGNNIGTHKGTFAIDNAGKDAGIDSIFAPVTMTLVTSDVARNGNALFFQSDDKVRFADGTINYLTMMFVHDNDIRDVLKVRKYKQGQKFGDEGIAGNATGNHCHMEFAKGKFTHMYNKNQYGVYYLPNNVSIEKVCFIDGTILKTTNIKWKYLKDVEIQSNNQGNKMWKIDDMISSGILSIKGGIKTLNGDDCVNVPDLGGYFPIRYLNVYDAGDGKKDQIIKNDKAKVVLAPTTIQRVSKNNKLVMVYGIWIKTDTLIKVK